MPKITVRIPTEQYAYIELEFNSIQEYSELYPEAVRAIKETRAKVKKQKEEEPFVGDEFSKK